ARRRHPADPDRSRLLSLRLWRLTHRLEAAGHRSRRRIDGTRVKDARHDLDAVHEPWTRPAEEGVAVNHPGLRCERIEAPAGGLELAQAAVQSKAARHHDHDLGIGVDHLL